MTTCHNTEADVKIAIAYLRVSTEDQKLGPEAQRAAIEAWAARESVTIAAWHCDHGVSGASEIDYRPGLLAALCDLRTHGASAIVVARRDCLAQSVGVALKIDDLVEAIGCMVHNADGVANGRSKTARAVRIGVDAALQHARETGIAATKAALAVLRAKGHRTGACPFGKTTDADGKTLVPDQRELAILVEILALDDVGLSSRKIERTLAGRGIVSLRTGKPFGHTQVWEHTLLARKMRADGSLPAATSKPSTGTVTLSDATCSRVRAVVAMMGVRPAAAHLGVSASTLTAGLAGLPIRAGSAALLEAA